MAELPATFVPDFHNVEDVKRMKYNDFGSTGLKISELSLGAGGFSDVYGGYSLEDCKTAVLKGLKAGINYIDTAPWYGQGTSEETLGKCLTDIPRQAYYLATKVGRYEKDPKLMFDFSAQKTRESLKKSFEKLGVDYVDVIQIHDIEFAPSLDYVIKETLPVLIDAVKEGKAKFIGVTGYPVGVLAEFIKKSPRNIDTVLSYTRFTLLDNTLLQYLDNFKGMGVINASALGMGLFTNVGPQPWHPAHQANKDVCEEARQYCISKGVEFAKLAMHYVYTKSRDLNCPHTQLVGMRTLKELETNLDVMRNGLTPHENEVLAYLQKEVFVKSKHRHWEGVEIEKYKELIASV